MKPVYNVHFVDTIYFHHSDEILANIAADFLHVFQSANFKQVEADISPKDRLFNPEILGGGVCVEARPGKVTIDFSRAVTQGWACSQIHDAETLIEEVFYRIKEKGVIFNEDVSLMQVLGQEITDFIDKFCVPASLSADDLVYNTQQTCESLTI